MIGEINSYLCDVMRDVLQADGIPMAIGQQKLTKVGPHLYKSSLCNIMN